MFSAEEARELGGRVKAAIDGIEIADGTEKQIDWARRIKIEQRNQLLESIRDSITFDYTEDSVRRWVDFITEDWSRRPARKTAKWWIDSRDAGLYGYIREQAKKVGAQLVPATD